MTDSKTATERLREMLDAHGVEYRIDFDGSTEWDALTGDYSSAVDVGGGKLVFTGCITPEQAVAATLGCNRDEVYDAGFTNGVKATLQQLDGLLIQTDSAVEIQAWVDRQWEEEVV